MNKTPIRTAEQRRILRALTELVQALEKRVPHVGRSGERQIALDSAALRKQAKRHILTIESEARRHEAADSATADSVMTDDGGPTPVE